MNKLCCYLTPRWSCKGCKAHWCKACGLTETTGHIYVGQTYDGSSWDERDFTCPVAGKVKISRQGDGGWFAP